MKILADPNMPLLSLFAPYAQVQSVPGRNWTNAQVREADALLTRSVTKVNKDLLEGTQVGFVGTATSGFDHIDRALLEARGIRFSYCPGSNAVSVADYVVAAVLQRMTSDSHRTKPLSDSRVGLIGYGHVGQVVARKLQALGMTCLINDPPRVEVGYEDVDYVDLATALKADVITLHTPLENTGPHATLDLIDAAALEQIPAGSMLINAARGGIVNEDALLARLDHGAGLYTVIDCWAQEPQINLQLLSRVDIATPHIAGYSYDGKLRATRMLYYDFLVWLEEQGLATASHVTDAKQALQGDSTHLRRTINLAQLAGGLSSIPSEETFAQALHSVIQQIYPILDDHARLIETSTMTEQARAQAFDQQRKNYPERREFDQFSVSIPAKLAHCHSDLASALGALDFHLT